jgi:hypothetical protein
LRRFAEAGLGPVRWTSMYVWTDTEACASFHFMKLRSSLGCHGTGPLGLKTLAMRIHTVLKTAFGEAINNVSKSHDRAKVNYDACPYLLPVQLVLE